MFQGVKFRNKLTYYDALYDKDKKGASTTARGVRTVLVKDSVYIRYHCFEVYTISMMVNWKRNQGLRSRIKENMHGMERGEYLSLSTIDPRVPSAAWPAAKGERIEVRGSAVLDNYRIIGEHARGNK